MTQSATTPKDTSPDLELIRKAGDSALKRLEKEFGLKLRKASTPADSKSKKDSGK